MDNTSDKTAATVPCHVFVYGTLKRGFRNHHVIGNEEFVESATTSEAYPLVVSGLPYLFNNPGQGHRVKGELYHIESSDSMSRLDSLEGHPRFYRRELIDVVVEGGSKPVKAWAYFINNKKLEYFDNPVPVVEYTDNRAHV